MKAVAWSNHGWGPGEGGGEEEGELSNPFTAHQRFPRSLHLSHP